MVKPSVSDIKPASGHNTFVVIVAAGSGTRFGADTPKQFLDLDGKPVLQHSVDTFRHALPDAEIILVLSPDRVAYWTDICLRNNYFLPRITEGGASRSESVHNALRTLNTNSSSVVMIHDGARPLVSEIMIRRIADQFSMPFTEAVVPTIPLTEAIAEKITGGVRSADRSRFKTVQTPQAFLAEPLLRFYNEAEGKELPDDAAIFSLIGGKTIIDVEGDRRNIKITNPDDIKLASFLRNLK